ncbi:MAG TPA: NAD(P)-binding protein [Acidimicrobiales bacterium]|nr:NAD(P)-binding protein [Acidimicrobiales bacterium]
MREPPFAITLDVGSSRANRTGSWRVQRPVYVDHLPPCNHACPAGEDIQGWLYRAEPGDYESAWRALVEDNPFPAVMGRVCFRPCEAACNRGRLDEAVGINAVERFLGDAAIEHGWPLPGPGPDTGRVVLVVGGGPAGLSAAYRLRRSGHRVRLVDASPQLGGMLRYGVPAYRLPRDVLDAEVARIVGMGVDVVLDHPVRDVAAEREQAGADAVFLAVGAQLGHRTEIPAGDAGRIVDAVTLLHGVAEGQPPALGRRVAVYGGGDTAFDAARTARRLGATDAVVVYRRTRERMPAHPEELDQAVIEGVTVRWLRTVDHFDPGHLVVERMVLDDAGFPQPTGEREALDADSLVLALGQDADLSLVDADPDVAVDHGAIAVDGSMMAAASGVFAGGDAVPSERTATVAIGHGARAARGIDAYLAGAPAPGAGRPVDARLDAPADAPPDLATFDRLNTWYYADAPRQHRPELERARRRRTFDEVVGGLTGENALFEARRCLSCGNCFECDNCFGVCPDNAVIKLEPGNRYEIDYDFCKGCGLCAEECPCGAIDMRPEPI